MVNTDKYVVTPWEVKGDVNYDKLIQEFGTYPITDQIMNKIEKYTKNLHPLIKRKIFFSHRDLDWILKKYELGEKFFLYTGRGPSGQTHLGHLVPWMFTKYLQDTFNVDLYFQITDDEKFLSNSSLSLNNTKNFAYDNILDIIALGFDPKKTFIFLNTEYSKTLYKIAINIAKHITFSTAKSVFGFANHTNIGMSFFPALQAAPCFLPSVKENKNIPCLIPAAIDQDPYWRGIARAVAPKLGYYKPAQIHSKFMPSLSTEGKMSASDPNTAIFTTDAPEIVERKIMQSFTGGKDTIKEQRELGGTPEICPVYHYYEFLFEMNDTKLTEIYNDCRQGHLLCGDNKFNLTEKINLFLTNHQKRREKALNKVDDFILRD